MKWTKEQSDAIRTTGTNLLVSAAAGSGKTAVLAERCAYLVCDAPEPCEVGELLVVTFTNAAAAEMRSRIEQALRKRQEASDSPRLTRQLLLLGRAPINTIHGFCTQLLRRHFHLVGLDPNFRVLDGEEITLLKQDIARQVLDDRYDSGDEGFHRLVDEYADGYDPRILGQIIQLHTLMESVVDPQEWLRIAAAKAHEAATAKRLIQSEMGREMAERIKRWLNELRGRWVALAKSVESIKKLSPYGEYVNNLLAAVEHWRECFGEGNFDALAKEIGELTVPRLPTIKDAPPQKEAIQARLGEIRDEMRKSTMASACRFTEREWQDALKATAGPSDLLVDLVREFGRRFTRAKRDLRGVDFSDLERLTLTSLRENPAIAALYRKQIRYVLVDEYQDVNPVQDAILGYLCREDNLFCVGDVKQSIYRFRLAQPKRFLERHRLFKSGKKEIGQVIDLSANFRSRGPLLGVINGVFQRCMSEEAVEIEYDQSHELRTGATYPPGTGDDCFNGAPIELHLLPPAPRDGADATGDSNEDLDRNEREAMFVASRIGELIAKKTQVARKSADGTLQMHPLRYRDIVVLLRSMRNKSQVYAQAMRTAGIPVHTESATGFFESTEVRDMLALLKVLDNQRQDIPLAAFLRSPMAELEKPEDALAAIRLEYPRIPFHEAAMKYSGEKSDALAERLKAIFTRLKDWRRMAHQRPVAELVWEIYDQTGYLTFCAGMADGAQRSANLIEFHERARQFGTFQRQGLGRFMQFLQSLADQADLGQASIASEADDVVRIMTIHKAKGLEFPVVFVPDLGKRHNLLDSRGSMLVDRDAGMGLMAIDVKKQVRYPTLSYVLVQDRILKQSLSEEMRVLYVALTRAREHLILVGTAKPETLAQWREQWGGHPRKLPMEDVLAGRTMLDWLGPAACMLATRESEPIQFTQHDEEEIARWGDLARQRPAIPPERAALVQLHPITPPPALDADAGQAIARLTRKYPAQPFTETAAATSVGAMTKGAQSPADWDDPWVESRSMPRSELRLPRFASTQASPVATEVGTATHLLLEQLDFTRPCDPEDLSLQISDLIRRKMLTPELADVVNREAILWLLSTPLGQRIRKHGTSLYRELPVYSPLSAPGLPESADPMDRIMLRGRLDLLVRGESGLLIVDYKTDSVTESTVDARAVYYAPQIQAYRQAIEQATGLKVVQSALVFLTPRIIREV